MRQTLNWYPQGKSDEFNSLNTRKSKDDLAPGELQEISNFTFDELGGLKKILGNSIVTNGVVTDNESQPDDDTAVDCYWDDDGDVQNDSFLKRDYLALKFPDAFFSGLANTILNASLYLYTVTEDVYNGTLYQNTADFTETSEDPPAYDNSSSVSVSASGASTEHILSLPTSWITDMVSTNYGMQVVATADPDGYFYSSVGLGAQYGDGSDGAITITSGTVNIDAIYEDDDVTGVTTNRGVNKGLNNGSGTYDPENDAYIQATDFTISSGATLTHSTAYGDGTSNKNGIIWIGCTGTFTNNGTIDMDALGATGGDGGTTAISQADAGDGSGGGGGGNRNSGVAGVGGTSYGESDIPTTTWSDLYGSGGGGGGGAGTGSSDATGGDGGNGGGAIRIYAATFNTVNGIISSNGEVGENGEQPDKGINSSGGGGGGAGGCIYIETLEGAIGTDKITASSGAGGTSLGSGFSDTGSGGGGGASVNNGSDASGTNNVNGGAGSVGRIHIEGSNYTGSTSDPANA